MAKRRAQIRLLAILVAAVVGPVGAENGAELHALKMAFASWKTCVSS